jgi:hypothetical protein
MEFHVYRDLMIEISIRSHQAHDTVRSYMIGILKLFTLNVLARRPRASNFTCAHSPKSIAKIAMGRKLAVRLYWMWRNGCEYSPSLEFGSYAGQLGTRNGVK